MSIKKYKYIFSINRYVKINKKKMLFNIQKIVENSKINKNVNNIELPTSET